MKFSVYLSLLPPEKNSDLKFHNYSRTIKKRFSKLTLIQSTSQGNKRLFDRTSQKTYTYSIKRKNPKETPSLPQQTSQCLIHVHYDQLDHLTTRQNKKRQNQIIRTMQTKNTTRKIQPNTSIILVPIPLMNNYPCPQKNYFFDFIL